MNTMSMTFHSSFVLFPYLLCSLHHWPAYTGLYNNRSVDASARAVVEWLLSAAFRCSCRTSPGSGAGCFRCHRRRAVAVAFVSRAHSQLDERSSAPLNAIGGVWRSLLPHARELASAGGTGANLNGTGVVSDCPMLALLVRPPYLPADRTTNPPTKRMSECLQAV